MTFDLKKLATKFNPEDIEWRVQQCGQGNNGNPWALIIPYITSRAIMQRLDDVVGCGSWKNEFTASPCNNGYMCGISIKIDNEWVTRWDGSEVTGAGNIDKVKSTMSSAMKRTGVQWGIGRYLYQFDAIFADAKTCDNRYKTLDGYTYQDGTVKSSNSKFGFQWKPKPLPAWALPVTENDILKTIAVFEEVKDLTELRFAWQQAYKMAVSENDDEMMKRLTDAKNKAKSRIDNNQEQQENKNKELLLKTIKDQIEIISCAVNESAVNGLTKLAENKVKLASSGNDLKMALTEIKKASNYKLNELRN